jgi:hypothetical protein
VQVGAERNWKGLAACGERMGVTTPKRGAAGEDDHPAVREKEGVVASVRRCEDLTNRMPPIRPNRCRIRYRVRVC